MSYEKKRKLILKSVDVINDLLNHIQNILMWLFGFGRLDIEIFGHKKKNSFISYGRTKLFIIYRSYYVLSKRLKPVNVQYQCLVIFYFLQ